MLISGAVNVALGAPLWLQLALADLLWAAFVLALAQALQEKVPATISR